MPQRRPIEKIHAAAWYFAHISRDVYEIAEAFKVSHDAVRKWAKTPEWHKALDVFKYEGDRTFAKQKTRDTEREQGETFVETREIYLELLANGEKPHRLPRLVAEELGIEGIDARTIYEWAKRYGWREDTEK